jgi:hypothetical protein
MVCVIIFGLYIVLLFNNNKIYNIRWKIKKLPSTLNWGVCLKNMVIPRSRTSVLTKEQARPAWLAAKIIYSAMLILALGAGNLLAQVVVDTSGARGMGAGNVCLTRLDPAGNSALEGVEVGTVIPDLIADTAHLSGTNLFRRIECKKIYVSGRCVIRVFGGLSVESFLPEPNAASPPELSILDASVGLVNFKVDFSMTRNPSLQRSGALSYRGSGPPLSVVSVKADGGYGTLDSKNGGRGGDVQLAHIGRVIVRASGGAGYSPDSSDTSSSSDGGNGGDAGRVSIKSALFVGGGGAFEQRKSLPSIDPVSLILAFGGNGGNGRDSSVNLWAAGRGGNGGAGPRIMVSGMGSGDVPAFGVGPISASGGVGGRGGDGQCPSDGSTVEAGTGGNAGPSAQISPGILTGSSGTTLGGKGGNGCRRGNTAVSDGNPGNSQIGFTSVAADPLSFLPDLPQAVTGKFGEWLRFNSALPSRKEIAVDGWLGSYDPEFGPSASLSIVVKGARPDTVAGCVGDIRIPYLAVVRGNSTNRVNLDRDSLLGVRDGYEQNRYGIFRWVIESTYLLSAPFNLLVTNRLELEPEVIYGQPLAPPNSTKPPAFSVINSPLESAFISQKARMLISYGSIGRSPVKQQIVVAQQFTANNIRQYPFLARESLEGGLQLYPNDGHHVPSGYIATAIPAQGAPQSPAEQPVCDNLHIADSAKPTLPGIWGTGSSLFERLQIPVLAGCGSCIHIHWRWQPGLKYLVNLSGKLVAPPPVVGSFNSFNFRKVWDDEEYDGRYIIPPNSHQTMDVALTDGQDFSDEYDLRLNHLGVTFPGEVNAVLLAKSSDETDSFFNFGFFVRSRLSEVDHSPYFDQQPGPPPAWINWRQHGATGSLTALGFEAKPVFLNSSDGVVDLQSIDSAGRHSTHLFYANAANRVSRAWLTSTNQGTAPSPVLLSQLGHFLHVTIPASLSGTAFLTDKMLVLESAQPLDSGLVKAMLTNSWIYRTPDSGNERPRSPVDVRCSAREIVVSVPASVNAVLEETDDFVLWRTNTVLRAGQMIRGVPVIDSRAEARFFRVRIPPP